MSVMTFKADEDDYGDNSDFPEDIPEISTEEKMRMAKRLKDQSDKRLKHLFELKSIIHNRKRAILEESQPENLEDVDSSC